MGYIGYMLYPMSGVKCESGCFGIRSGALRGLGLKEFRDKVKDPKSSLHTP